MQALLDTGAGMSFINCQFALEHKLKIQPPRRTINVLVASGATIKTLGYVEATICIGDLQLPVTLQVLKEAPVNVILGMDFLTESHATIDLATHSVRFSDNLTAVKLVHTGFPIVRVAKPVKIPAMSEAVIEGRVNCKFHQGNFLLEPLENLAYYDLALARTLVRPKRGRVLCRLMNPTLTDIHLTASTPLATAEPAAALPAATPSVNSYDSCLTMQQKIQQLRERKIKLPTTKLPQHEFESFVDFLFNNRDLFATTAQDLPGTDLVKFDIDTGDHPPVARGPYRYSEFAKRQIEQHCQDLLDAGIIVPSTSPWSSGVVLAAKKDGSTRLCVDFRGINACTKIHPYPLPTFTSLLDTLAAAKPTIMSSLDLAMGYHQVHCTDRAAERTSFVTHSDKYQFTRMPFGCAGSSHCFSKLMATCLRGLTWKICLAYLDDVLIFSKSYSEHLNSLSLIFSRFRSAKLRLNGKKCEFLLQEIEWLGHVISPQGIRPSRRNVKAVQEFPRPTNQKQLRSWLGLCNYYRRFIKGYAQITSVYRDLLSKETEFEWTSEHETAFCLLRDLMTSAPLLHHIDNQKQITVTTDASTYAIGWVLSQPDEHGKLHPCIYGGKSLNKHQQRWSVSEREMFAVLEAIRQNNIYLIGQKFIVESDHIALSFLDKIKTSTGRLGRWSVLLSQYSFELRYKKGSSLTHADALSRRTYEPEPQQANDDDSDDDEQPFLPYMNAQNVAHAERAETAAAFLSAIRLQPADLSDDKQVLTLLTPDLCQRSRLLTTIVEPELTDIARMQENCNDCKPLLDYLRYQTLPSDDRQARKVIIESEFYCLNNGILHHLSPARGKRQNGPDFFDTQLVVPTPLRPKILQAYHDQNCHIGFDKLYATIRLKYYWQGLYTDAADYVKHCDVCQRSKRPAHPHNAPGICLPCADNLERLHMDHIGPLPDSNGYKHILVCIDAHSLWCELIPTVSTSVEEVVNALQDVIIPRYGCPVKILTDRHASFASKVYEAATRIWGVKQIKTSGLHPQTNNRAEVFNSSLLKSLRALTQDQHKWSEFLPAVALSYRASVTTSHGYSPFEVLYGKPMRLVIDTSIIHEVNTTPDVGEYLERLIPRVQAIRETAKANNSAASERAKFYYDWNARWPTFKVGDEVLLYWPAMKKEQCKKLTRQWIGPYIIEQTFDNFTYIIREVATEKRIDHHIHSSRLRPYHRRLRKLQQPRTSSPHDTQQPQQPDRPTDPMATQRATSPQNSYTNTTDNPTSSANGTKTPTVAADKQQQLPDGWYELQRLIGKRRMGGKIHYQVLRKDGTKSYEPAENITDDAIQAYEKQQRAQRQRRKRNA